MKWLHMIFWELVKNNVIVNSVCRWVILLKCHENCDIDGNDSASEWFMFFLEIKA